MRKLIAATTLAATAVLAGGTGYALHSQATPASCTFDGGGTIANGSMATVSTGQTYFCDDGTLVRYYM
jgi:hypothetical protein